MPAKLTLMPSPWSEESCSSSSRATFGGSGTASWRAATRRWRPVTGKGFPATLTPHLKTRQETFGSFRVSRRVQTGVMQVGDSRHVWCTVGQVRTGVMDNEITVVNLLECCLTHCSVHWVGVHKHKPFHPNVWNIWCHYWVPVYGGDAPFDAFDLLLSNLTPSKRLEEGSQTPQGFISCHLCCSTNWSFKLNMTQKRNGTGIKSNRQEVLNWTQQWRLSHACPVGLIMLRQTWNLNYCYIWLSLWLVCMMHNKLRALDRVLAAAAEIKCLSR